MSTTYLFGMPAFIPVGLGMKVGYDLVMKPAGTALNAAWLTAEVASITTAPAPWAGSVAGAFIGDKMKRVAFAADFPPLLWLCVGAGAGGALANMLSPPTK